MSLLESQRPSTIGLEGFPNKSTLVFQSLFSILDSRVYLSLGSLYQFLLWILSISCTHLWVTGLAGRYLWEQSLASQAMRQVVLKPLQLYWSSRQSWSLWVINKVAYSDNPERRPENTDEYLKDAHCWGKMREGFCF